MTKVKFFIPYGRMHNSFSKFHFNEIQNVDSSRDIAYEGTTANKGTRVVLIMFNDSFKLMSHLLVQKAVQISKWVKMSGFKLIYRSTNQ